MGLLQESKIKEEDIYSIEVALERPESMLGIIRIEGISIYGKNIDRDAEVKINNELVDNTEFFDEYKVVRYVSKKLGISTDFIQTLG